jgi:hypothetical protein
MVVTIQNPTIAAVTPILLQLLKLTDVACFGDNTGSARFYGYWIWYWVVYRQALHHHQQVAFHVKAQQAMLFERLLILSGGAIFL